jgi:hypothetical protein
MEPVRVVDAKPEDPLQAAARHVRTEHAAIKRSVKDVIDRAMKLGDFLKEKKAQLGHGNFITWVETECEVDRRMAQRYMKAAEGRAVIEKYKADGQVKSDTMSSLTLTGALRLIAKDKPEPPTAVHSFDKTVERLVGKVGTLPDDQREDHVEAAVNDLRAALKKKATEKPVELKTGTTG